jgi:iron complex transport system substrate-binding protein
MKLFRIFAVIAILSLLVLAGCSDPAVQKTPLSSTYIDDIGRTVKIIGIPQRIISLSPSNTEMVYALGLQDKLVGVTSYDNYPPDAKNKPIVSDYSIVDLEKIVNAKPDLVLADSIQEKDTIPALEKLGITVYTMTPNNINGILNEIKVLMDLSPALQP